MTLKIIAGTRYSFYDSALPNIVTRTMTRSLCWTRGNTEVECDFEDLIEVLLDRIERLLFDIYVCPIPPNTIAAGYLLSLDGPFGRKFGASHRIQRGSRDCWHLSV